MGMPDLLVTCGPADYQPSVSFYFEFDPLIWKQILMALGDGYQCLKLSGKLVIESIHVSAEQLQPVDLYFRI